MNCPLCGAALPLLFDGDFQIFGGCPRFAAYRAARYAERLRLDDLFLLYRQARKQGKTHPRE
jgi:hypothetical protein